MWGNAQSGALGLPDHHIHAQWLPRAMYTPDTAVGRPGAVMVACGCSFTLVLDACGVVWSCGSGHCGQLGQGDDVDTYVLKKINADSFGGMPIGMIAVGGWHSMAVERDTGVLWTWGCNENGKLGQDHRRDNTSLPASIDAATFHDTAAKAAAVAADAAGQKHSYSDDVVMSVAGGTWWSPLPGCCGGVALACKGSGVLATTMWCPCSSASVAKITLAKGGSEWYHATKITRRLWHTAM